MCPSEAGKFCIFATGIVLFGEYFLRTIFVRSVFRENILLKLCLNHLKSDLFMDESIDLDQIFFFKLTRIH